MINENNEVAPQELDEVYPLCQTPVMENINLAHLRLMHGNNYGTSGYGIIHAVPETSKANALRLIDWSNECEKVEGNPEVMLTQGIDLLKTGYADFNSLKHLFGRYDAEWSIHLGEVMLKLKKLVKRLSSRPLWGGWAAENLPFIKPRTREKFMNLAKRRDCHPYVVLGVERLDVLCTATKDSTEANPIGSFMSKHSIPFDPEQEFDLDEFKLQVDVAINMEKLELNGIRADIELVKGWIIEGKKIDRKSIQEMKEIIDSGGDHQVFMKRRLLDSGQEAVDVEEKRLSDFQSLSQRLIMTIDYILKDHEDEIERINAETFMRLTRKLAMLQRLANFTEPVIEAV